MSFARRSWSQMRGIGGLALRIVGDPDDGREIEVAAEAIRNVREF
jgi:hypothetical protein